MTQQQLINALVSLDQDQVGELNTLLDYDVIETSASGPETDLSELAAGLNGVQYIEDAEELFAALAIAAPWVAIGPSPVKSRIKRPTQ